MYVYTMYTMYMYTMYTRLRHSRTLIVTYIRVHGTVCHSDPVHIYTVHGIYPPLHILPHHGTVCHSDPVPNYVTASDHDPTDLQTGLTYCSPVAASVHLRMTLTYYSAVRVVEILNSIFVDTMAVPANPTEYQVSVAYQLTEFVSMLP